MKRRQFIKQTALAGAVLATGVTVVKSVSKRPKLVTENVDNGTNLMADGFGWEAEAQIGTGVEMR